MKKWTVAAMVFFSLLLFQNCSRSMWAVTAPAPASAQASEENLAANIVTKQKCKKQCPEPFRADAAVTIRELQTQREKVAQGLARIGKSHWLMSQDTDGSSSNSNENAKPGLSFTLLNNSGDIVDDWEFDYGAHPQNIVVVPMESGYKILTDDLDGTGMAAFFLRNDLRSLVRMKESAGFKKKANSSLTSVKKGSFAIQQDKNLIARISWSEKENDFVVTIYNFAKFLKDEQVILSSFRIHGDRLHGGIQGFGMDKVSVYILFGNTLLHGPHSEKILYRYSLDGDFLQKIIPEKFFPAVQKLKANLVAEKAPNFEPESLHIDNNALYYTMNSNRNSHHHIYRVRIPLPASN